MNDCYRIRNLEENNRGLNRRIHGLAKEVKLLAQDLDRARRDLVGQQELAEQRRWELRSILTGLCGVAGPEADRLLFVEGEAYRIVQQKLET